MIYVMHTNWYKHICADVHIFLSLQMMGRLLHNVFKVLRLHLLFLKLGGEENLPGKRVTYNGACISFARLPRWINCTSKIFLPEPHFKKDLSYRERKLPFTHMETRKSEEAPDFPPQCLISLLPFMRNLVQEVALQGNWIWNGHKSRNMFSLRTVICVPEQSKKGQT